MNSKFKFLQYIRMKNFDHKNNFYSLALGDLARVWTLPSI